MLMNSAGFLTTVPIYFNRAAETSDPVERMKLLITGNFAWFVYMSMFKKPLNPILGETYECIGQDGTKLCMEQTSHHPPRGHFFADGPNGNFKMNGYFEIAIYAGMQSSTAESRGFKEIVFKDGGKIRWNLNNDRFSGLFMGTMNHQLTGRVTFTDEQNDITAYYDYGAYTFSKQDFVWGEISQGGKKISEIYGNYNGFLDFDKVRYWDARKKDEVFFPIAGEEINSLPSQSSKRTDGRFFISDTVEVAQAEKERLENIQRNDRKLREEAAARRAAGGPKYKPR